MASSPIFASRSSSSLRWIFRRGIFTSPYSCRGSKIIGARMMSTMSVISSNDSSTNCNLPSRKSSSPWLMLPPDFEGGDMIYNFYSIAENKVLRFNKRGGGGGEEELPDDDARIVGSSQGWLILQNEGSYDLFLSNPLSRRHIKLPPIRTLPLDEEHLRQGSKMIYKVIISGSPDEEECRAMMIFFGSPDHYRLAFCCPGRSCRWTPIGSLYQPGPGPTPSPDDEVYRFYDQFVYSSRHKVFFCVTKFEHADDMEGWDLRDPRSPRIVWSDEDMLKRDEEEIYSCSPWWEVEYCCSRHRYLVFAEQSNQLLFVTRYVMDRMGPDGSYVDDIYCRDDSYPYKTIGFDVHEIDREGRKLRYMDASLDGLAMFVGLNHSFALSTAEFPELRPNSIYFTDDNAPPKWDDTDYGGHDVGIFDYKNGTISPCYYPCDIQSVKRIMPAPLWFTPTPH